MMENAISCRSSTLARSICSVVITDGSGTGMFEETARRSSLIDQIGLPLTVVVGRRGSRGRSTRAKRGAWRAPDIGSRDRR